jgi:hypothetical protein
MLSLGAIGCSTSVQFDGEGQKVIDLLTKENQYRINNEDPQEFSEVKLVRELTASDSLNILLNSKVADEIIESHSRMADNIQYQIQKSSDPSYADNSNTTVEERIDEINLFADAALGKFDDKFTFVSFYKAIYRLKSMPQDQVVCKMYAITHKRQSDTKWITDYWFFNPSIDGSAYRMIQLEDTKQLPKAKTTLKQIQFDYVIDERNFMSSGVE